MVVAVGRVWTTISVGCPVWPVGSTAVPTRSRRGWCHTRPHPHPHPYPPCPCPYPLGRVPRVLWLWWLLLVLLPRSMQALRYGFRDVGVRQVKCGVKLE